MALDEGWPERMASFAPWMAAGSRPALGQRRRSTDRGSGRGADGPRRGQPFPLLARPVRALRLAPAWAPNYSPDGVRGGRDALAARPARPPRRSSSRALREKALPADFRFPMTDARLALGRLVRPRRAHRRGSALVRRRPRRARRAGRTAAARRRRPRRGPHAPPSRRPAAAAPYVAAARGGVRPARDDRLDPSTGHGHHVLLAHRLARCRQRRLGRQLSPRPRCDRAATACGEHVGVRESEITGPSGTAESGAVLAELRGALEPSHEMGSLITDLDVVERYRSRRGRLGRVRHPAGGGTAEEHRRGRRRRARVCVGTASRSCPWRGHRRCRGAPTPSTACVVLCTEQMRTIVEINPGERLAVVQPGVVNDDLRAAAAEHGLWYPPDPASAPWSTIGGNVATNAGGLCCVKYGVTRDYVLALEVVTASGRGRAGRAAHREGRGGLRPGRAHGRAPRARWV